MTECPGEGLKKFILGGRMNGKQHLSQSQGIFQHMAGTWSSGNPPVRPGIGTNFAAAGHNMGASRMPTGPDTDFSLYSIEEMVYALGELEKHHEKYANDVPGRRFSESDLKDIIDCCARDYNRIEEELIRRMLNDD